MCRSIAWSLSLIAAQKWSAKSAFEPLCGFNVKGAHVSLGLPSQEFNKAQQIGTYL